MTAAVESEAGVEEGGGPVRGGPYRDVDESKSVYAEGEKDGRGDEACSAGSIQPQHGRLAVCDCGAGPRESAALAGACSCFWGFALIPAAVGVMPCTCSWRLAAFEASAEQSQSSRAVSALEAHARRRSEDGPASEANWAPWAV